MNNAANNTTVPQTTQPSRGLKALGAEVDAICDAVQAKWDELWALAEKGMLPDGPIPYDCIPMGRKAYELRLENGRARRRECRRIDRLYLEALDEAGL
jgi:hypothetical protein